MEKEEVDPILAKLNAKNKPSPSPVVEEEDPILKKLNASKKKEPTTVKESSRVGGKAQPATVGSKPLSEESKPAEKSTGALDEYNRRQENLMLAYQNQFQKEAEPIVSEIVSRRNSEIEAKQKELQSLVDARSISVDAANKQLSDFSKAQSEIIKNEIEAKQKELLPSFLEKNKKDIAKWNAIYADDFQKKDFQENKITNIAESIWTSADAALTKDLPSSYYASLALGASGFNKADQALEKSIKPLSDKINNETKEGFADKVQSIISKVVSWGIDESPEEIKKQINSQKSTLSQSEIQKNIVIDNLRKAIDYSDQSAESKKYLINTLDKAKGGDFIDYMNYVAAAVGQGLGQIPASIGTRGTTSIVQQVGSIYLESVQKLAEEESVRTGKKVTYEDIIRQGKDDVLWPLITGFAGGLLDAYGANKMNPFNKQEMLNSFRKRAIALGKVVGIESVTEAGQTTLENFGISKASGESWEDAFKNFNWNNVTESALQGGIASLFLGAGGQAVNKGRQSLKSDQVIIAPGAFNLPKSPKQVVSESQSSVKSTDDTQGALASADKIVAATETYKPGDTVELSTEVTNKDENVADLTLSEQKSENKVIENTLSEQGQQPPRDITTKSDEDIERRMLDLEGKTMFGSPELSEYNTLEKEMEKREWNSVFSVPIQEAKSAIDNLIKKEKEMPNGYGAFIEKRDASESKQIIEKYSDKKSISDNDIKKDFKEALMGRPSTWYADGLKLRESANLAAERGIEMSDLLAEVEQEFVKDGYDPKTAKEVIAGYLAKINPTASKSTISEPTGETPSLASESKSLEAPVREEQGIGQGADMEFTSTVGDNYVKRNNRWFVIESDGTERPVISDNPSKAPEEQNAELTELKKLKKELESQSPVNVDLSPTGKGRIAQMDAFTPEGRARKWLLSGGKLLWNSKSTGEGKKELRGIKDETGFGQRDKSGYERYLNDKNGISVERAAEQLADFYGDEDVQKYRNALIEVFSTDPKTWYEQQVRDEDADYAYQQQQRQEEANLIDQQILNLEAEESGITETNQQLYENERRVNYGVSQSQDQGAGATVGGTREGSQAQVDPRASIRKNGNADKSKQAVAELATKNLTHVPGLGMGQNQAKGTYISTEDQNRYETEDKKPVKVKVDIQNPFVSEDDTFYNIQREIIQSRFGKNQIEDLTEAEADLLAEMVTEHFMTEGFDAIYMPQSETQEGELIVFDRSKVTIMDEARIEYENAVHESTQTTLQLEFIPDAEFLKTDKPIELREKQKKIRKDLARLNQLIKCR